MPIRRRRPTAAASALAWAALLGLLLVLGTALPAAAQRAEPEPLPLPADLGPAAPLREPTPLGPARVDPREGLHFGLGFPLVEVRSDRLGVRVKGSKPASTGVLIHAEGVWGNLRAGYARQLLRLELPPGAALEGTAVDTLSMDASQFWGFHGFRPHHSLYLGYGLGWQHRLIRLRNSGGLVLLEPDSSFLAGLMADWGLALPFSLQLRVFQDLGEGLVETRGASVQIAFIAPF